MEKSTHMGMNKTGAQMAPGDIDRMVQDVEQRATAAADGSAIAGLRTSYITEAGPVGTVPAPGTIKGAAKSGLQKLAGRSPEVLVDKLGERLAFERTGVRLYDALMTKYQALSSKPVGIPADQLARFRDEEAKHFKWVADALETLGADPTAQTPAADITGVESMGLMQVVDDPRTTLSQSLHALLVAELADNAGWELLITLAEDLGQDDMTSNFRQALQEEQSHLTHVRSWLEQSVRNEAQAAT